MSFIVKDARPRFEELLRELLRIRYDILNHVDFAKLFDYDSSRQLEIVSSIRRSEASHYESLASFLLASEQEREEIFRAVLNKDKSATLPGGGLEFLLELTTFSEDEKIQIEKRLGNLVNSIIRECIDVRKLTNIVKKNYSNNVTITDGTIFIAVSEAFLRVNRLIENESYLYSWIKAETSQEAKKTAFPITHNKLSASDFVHLEMTIGDGNSGRAYHEMIGAQDSGYEKFEMANLNLYRAKSLLEVLEELDVLQNPGIQEDDLAYASEKLIDVVIEMEEYYSYADYDAVLSLWNEFAEIMTETVEKHLPRILEDKESRMTVYDNVRKVFDEDSDTCTAKTSTKLRRAL